MATFLLTFFVLALVMGAMAIGLIVNKKPIKGTCASLSNLTDSGECVVCGKKPDEQNACEVDSPSIIRDRLYYAADKPEKRIMPNSTDRESE